MSARAWLRRRGATFTIIVLLASALLLSIGGAFVDASRNLITLASLRERNEQCREALAGAAQWARCAVAQGQVAGKTTIKLSRAIVEVDLKSEGDAYFVDAVARSGEALQRAKASIAKREGRWALTRFELVDPSGALPPSAPPSTGGEKKKFR
jgi:hypothetical protein